MSTTITLELPPEFLALCEADEVAPETVLRGFIADLCAIGATGATSGCLRGSTTNA
jgi:hypothetical protein